MSSETRSIRPFIDFGEIDALFETATLLFGNETCTADSRVVFDRGPAEFQASSVALTWADENEFDSRLLTTLEVIEELEIEAESLSLVVMAVSSYLKHAMVVYELPFTELLDLPRTIDLIGDSRAPAFDAVHHGFTVEAHIVLNEAIEPRPLLPRRKGTWLARTEFEVVTKSISSLFRPIPLTEELRKQLRLGARVTRYVQFDEHDPLRPFDEQSEPMLYVDDEILARMAATPRTPASQAVQLGLVLEFTQAAIAVASRSDELAQLSFEDIAGSVIHRLIDFAAPKGDDAERHRVFDEISSDPDWVSAYVEHALGIRKPLLAALEGDDT